MVKIIDGKKLAEKIKNDIVKEILKINDNCLPAKKRPNLAIIIIGERQDSMLYVDLKEKEAKKVGLDIHTYKCPENISEKKVYEMIDCLNKDKLIDAILVQLPLPSGFDTDGIIRAIDPAKDVDRFHPDNLEILFSTCNHNHVMPPVFQVVLEILKSINYNIQNKKIYLISNSNIFGNSLVKVLACQGAKAKALRVQDIDLAEKTKKADILITAIGRPGFIK